MPPWSRSAVPAQWPTSSRAKRHYCRCQMPPLSRSAVPVFPEESMITIGVKRFRCAEVLFLQRSMCSQTETSSLLTPIASVCQSAIPAPKVHEHPDGTFTIVGVGSNSRCGSRVNTSVVQYWRLVLQRMRFTRQGFPLCSRQNFQNLISRRRGFFWCSRHTGSYSSMKSSSTWLVQRFPHILGGIYSYYTEKESLVRCLRRLTSSGKLDFRGDEFPVSSSSSTALRPSVFLHIPS